MNGCKGILVGMGFGLAFFALIAIITTALICLLAIIK